MRIKKTSIVILPVALFLAVTFAGCGILAKNKGVSGKASAAENKAKTRIEAVDDTAAKVDSQRLDKIGAFASGIDYLLHKDTNQSPEAAAAETLNERVMGLANKPDFAEKREIASMADLIVANHTDGQKTLSAKDKEIETLGLSVKDLKTQKEQAVKSYVRLADKNAANADQYRQTLGQMDSFLGLGAIWYGIKRLFLRFGLILGIGSILFLALRITSMSNPIAASIFSIFNQAGSWLVNGLAVLFPKALQLAGNTATAVFTAYKGTMIKIVDAIQIVRDRAEANGKPATIEDYLTEAEKSMNADEKAIVQELKKALNWKQ